MKRLAVILTLLLAIGVLGARAEPAFAQDNTAIAINTEDGASVFDFAFKVRRVMNNVVDNQNAAVAYASCEECQTVATAIQIVLVFSDPQVVTPENIAIALNEGCDTCETVASAYQFVFSVPEKFKFSKDAWKRIVEIREEIEELGEDFEDGELSALELQEQIDLLVDELRTVIKTDIAAGGEQKGKDENAENEETETDVDEGEEPTDTDTMPTDTTETSPTTTTTP
jgi:putative peptide zinc metalloprotease protein